MKRKECTVLKTVGANFLNLALAELEGLLLDFVLLELSNHLPPDAHNWLWILKVICVILKKVWADRKIN